MRVESGELRVEQLAKLLKHAFALHYFKDKFHEAIAAELVANGVRLEEKQATSNASEQFASEQFASDNHVGGKWIPVMERLPVMHKVRYEDCVEPTGYGECFVSDHVLAYCSGGERFYVVECARSEENGPLYWTKVTSDITVRPTHWMLLPEPPKGE